VQVLSASVFLTIGFLGAYHQSTVLLGLGFIAHGAWDWVHHDGHGPTHVRTWYPPFCVTVDVVTGVPLLAGCSPKPMASSTSSMTAIESVAKANALRGTQQSPAGLPSTMNVWRASAATVIRRPGGGGDSFARCLAANNRCRS
jgi:hypothetical protein